MIIDHTHPIYRNRRRYAGENKYNGAYYYSKDIVKCIIPNVITDYNWITVNLPELADTDIDLSHSIVFIHNNLQPNAYQWLRKYNDLILVCGIPSTMEKVQFFGTPIYLPLSVNVDQVLKYKCEIKDKIAAFAGRRNKINNHVPSWVDILTNMPRSKLLKEMARYQSIYAVGRTAIEAKILGCKIEVYDERFPIPKLWKIIDCYDAAIMLTEKLNQLKDDIICQVQN